MNINELTDKNLSDAVLLYRIAVKNCPNYDACELGDEEIAKKYKDAEYNGDYTYMFYDRGQPLAVVTVCKFLAEIQNMSINHSLVDKSFYDKFLEFVIKQFSAITRVFLWVLSVDISTSNMLEDYGFEYTGEQEYVSKEHNILRFKYVYKRKK